MLMARVRRSGRVAFLVTRLVVVVVLTAIGIRRLWCIIKHPSRPHQRLRKSILLRKFFEDMGPVFIKFGQIVASSPGLFPDVISSEFKRCLDRVPSFPAEEALTILRAELGCPIGQVFADINPAPIAAASIAQVHAATLRDGTKVVIKVQRPRIKEIADADLWFMRHSARVLERFSIHARIANLRGMVEDFTCTLAQELDFLQEAAHMNEFNEIMQTHAIDRVFAPRVFPEWSTSRVLIMEHVEGVKADDFESSRDQDFDAERYIRTSLRTWLLTVLLHGFFHGDVHAGNLMFCPATDRIAFLDFGIVGRFKTRERDLVLRYILAFTNQDFRGLAQTIVDVGSAPAEIDIDAFAEDLAEVYAPIMATRMGDMQPMHVLPGLFRNAQKFGVTLPREFLLIIKQLLYFDRYARLGAPNLNVFTDLHLIDFLFTPAAAEAGIDINELMRRIPAIQSRIQGSNPTVH